MEANCALFVFSFLFAGFNYIDAERPLPDETDKEQILSRMKRLDDYTYLGGSFDEESRVKRADQIPLERTKRLGDFDDEIPSVSREKRLKREQGASSHMGHFDEEPKHLSRTKRLDDDFPPPPKQQHHHAKYSQGMRSGKDKRKRMERPGLIHIQEGPDGPRYISGKSYMDKEYSKKIRH